MRGIYETTVKQVFDRYCQRRDSVDSAAILKNVVKIPTMIVYGSTCIHSKPKKYQELTGYPL